MKFKQIQKNQETKIGIIPKDWEINELQKVSKVIDSAHITPEYSSDGFSMIRVTDIKSGFLDLKKSFKVTREVYEKFTKNHKPRKNDIVMGRVGTYGITSFVNTDEPFCLGQNTVVIHSPISRFIYYALNSKYMKNQIEEKVVGSTQKTISLANIRELQLAIPTNSEEISYIEKILFELDLKINTLQIQNQILEKLIQSIFKSWFIDFDGQTEFIDSELGSIPKEWNICKISSLCESIDYGYTQSSTSENIGPKFLRITDITNTNIDWFTVPYCDINIKNHQKYKLNNNDIVIARTGATTGVSKLIINPPDAVFASYLIRLKIKPTHSPRFVSTFLSSPQYWNYIRGVLGDKSAQPNANATTLTLCDVIVPTNSYIEKFESLCNPIDKKIRSNLQIIEILSEIQNSLLPKLMLGEIRI